MDNEEILEEIANLGECTCPRLHKAVSTASIGEAFRCKKHGYTIVDRLETALTDTSELEVKVTLRVYNRA